MKLLKKFNINSDRITVYKQEAGRSKSYVPESAWIVEDLLSVYEEEQMQLAHCVFSDNGNSFFEDGVSVIEKHGYTHVLYAADVHQFLSVNDNNAHGVAKAIVRNDAPASPTKSTLLYGCFTS